MKKHLLLICTGSVAIEKIFLIKNILKKKYQIKILATPYVKKHFDGYLKMNCEDYSLQLDEKVEHINLVRWADLIIVVPASANTLAKFATGIADNFALTILLAARQPIIFVPAMNSYMYQSLIDRDVFQKISQLGHLLIGPVYGKLKEKEIGWGRMEEPELIGQAIDNYLSKDNKKIILLPYGSGKTWLDPVRFISNASSGLMGRLLANQLQLSGYQVKAININKYHSNIDFIEDAKKIPYDIFISPAAFSDFEANYQSQKISRQSEYQINFQSAPDVLRIMKNYRPQAKYFGFKLSNDASQAQVKLQELNLNGIIWNKLSSIRNQTSSGAIFTKKEIYKFNNLSKIILAKKIVEILEW